MWARLEPSYESLWLGHIAPEAGHLGNVMRPTDARNAGQLNDRVRTALGDRRQRLVNQLPDILTHIGNLHGTTPSKGRLLASRCGAWGAWSSPARSVVVPAHLHEVIHADRGVATVARDEDHELGLRLVQILELVWAAMDDEVFGGDATLENSVHMVDDPAGDGRVGGEVDEPTRAAEHPGLPDHSSRFFGSGMEQFNRPVPGNRDPKLAQDRLHLWISHHPASVDAR